jgi:hypothetical protein
MERHSYIYIPYREIGNDVPFMWCAGTWQVHLRRKRLFCKTIWLRRPILAPIGERRYGEWVKGAPCPSYAQRSDGTKKVDEVHTAWQLSGRVLPGLPRVSPRRINNRHAFCSETWGVEVQPHGAAGRQRAWNFPTTSVGPSLQATLEFRFFPNKDVSGTELVPLGRRQPPGNQRENVESDRLEDDVCIPRITDVCRWVGKRTDDSEALKNIRREG